MLNAACEFATNSSLHDVILTKQRVGVADPLRVEEPAVPLPLRRSRFLDFAAWLASEPCCFAQNDIRRFV